MSIFSKHETRIIMTYFFSRIYAELCFSTCGNSSLGQCFEVISQKLVMRYWICMNGFATKKGQVVALFVKGHIIAKSAEISDHLHEIRFEGRLRNRFSSLDTRFIFATNYISYTEENSCKNKLKIC